MRPRAPAVAFAALAVAAGCNPLTDVLVRVQKFDVSVPGDIASVRMQVTNPTAQSPMGRLAYQSQQLVLCGAGATSGCFNLPLTATLAPGPQKPSAQVRVEIDGFDGGGNLVTSDSSSFAFVHGQEQTLDFSLYKSCLGMQCASMNQACLQNGACGTLAPQALHPHAAAGPIARISAVPGTVGSAHMVLPPPATQPGDLVVLALLVDLNVNAGVPGWTLAAGADQTNAVYYHFAADGDAQSGLYTFDLVGDSYGGFLLLVYRGVGSVLPGTSGAAPPYDFAPVVRAPSGSVVLGLVGGDHPACDSTGAIGNVVSTTNWSAWDLPTMNGQTADLALPCTTVAGGGVGWVYQLVLAP